MNATLACRDVVELLCDYVEDLLPSAARRALEDHLAGCPKCVQFLQEYRETPRLMREATAERMPAELKVKLDRFLRARSAAARHRRD